MATFRSSRDGRASFRIMMVEKHGDASGYDRDFRRAMLQPDQGLWRVWLSREPCRLALRILFTCRAGSNATFPAAFACGLLNSQPMGFYAPAQIVRDAAEHGVTVLPVGCESKAAMGLHAGGYFRKPMSHAETRRRGGIWGRKKEKHEIYTLTETQRHRELFCREAAINILKSSDISREPENGFNAASPRSTTLSAFLCQLFLSPRLRVSA